MKLCFCTKITWMFVTKCGNENIFQKTIALLFIVMYNYSANEKIAVNRL